MHDLRGVPLTIWSSFESDMVSGGSRSYSHCVVVYDPKQDVACAEVQRGGRAKEGPGAVERQSSSIQTSPSPISVRFRTSIYLTLVGQSFRSHNFFFQAT